MVEILFAKKTDVDTDVTALATHKADVTNPHTVTAAQVGLSNAQIKTAYEANADTNEFSDAEQTKLVGVETSATADQTGAEIKTAYEAEANAYTDAKDTKLSGIEAAADVTDEANVTTALPVSDATSLVKDPADATKLLRLDVGALTTATTRVLTMPDQNVDLTPGVTFQADLAVPSQAEAEAGTATTERVWTAQRVGQAVVALSPSSIGKHGIWIPARALRPTVSNGCASLASVETTAGRPDMQVLDFDGTADEHAQFDLVLGNAWNAGTVTFQVYHTIASAITTGVAWALQGVSVANDQTIDVAYGTAVVVTDTYLNAAEDEHISAESGAVTLGGTVADLNHLYFRLFRDVSDAADNTAADARLLGIMLFVTTTAGTDA